MDEAREGLKELLDVDDIQADAILAMQLRKLAALERVVRDGLDTLAHHRGHPGHLALPRAQDVAAAYHRVRR